MFMDLLHQIIIIVFLFAHIMNILAMVLKKFLFIGKY